MEDLSGNIKRKLYSLGHYMKWHLCRHPVRKSMNESGNIYIFGESRGGSTFFTELFLNGRRSVLWEPLMPASLEKYDSGFYRDLGNIPYIPSGNAWLEGIDFFNKFFNGHIIMPAMLNFKLPEVNYINPEQCIIKFCRANALLPWLTAIFNIKPLYLIRHPLAVISSQLRFPKFHGYKVHSNVLHYQEGRFKDLFYDHEEKISDIRSVEEMFTVWWCLKNYEAVFSQNKKWLTVSYEYFLSDPQSEKERIEKYLGLNISDDFEKKFGSPSSTTLQGSNVLAGKEQLGKWKRDLDKKQVSTILDTLYKFGFDMFSDRVEPEYTGLDYK